MSIGLDIGGQELRSLFGAGHEVRARRCRAVYATLPDTPAQRSLLERVHIPFAECDCGLVLLGDSALEAAPVFQTACRPLLPGGNLPQDDPLSRQILAALVERLLPAPAEPGEICCFAGDSAGSPGSSQRRARQEFLAQLIRLRGYVPVELPTGMAVVYAEVVSQGFTGIALDCGASGCDFSVAVQGREIASGRVPEGGDWIDRELALALGLDYWDVLGRKQCDVEAARLRKEVCTGRIDQPANEEQQALAAAYATLLEGIVAALAQQFGACPELSQRSGAWDVVCSGGTARVAGFCEMLRQAFQRSGLPIEIRNIRTEKAPGFTVARGCLINTLLEQQARLLRGEAA